MVSLVHDHLSFSELFTIEGDNCESVILSWLEFMSPSLPFEEKQNELYQIAMRAQNEGSPRVGQWLLDSRQLIEWRDGLARKLWFYGIRK